MSTRGGPRRALVYIRAYLTGRLVATAADAAETVRVLGYLFIQERISYVGGNKLSVRPLTGFLVEFGQYKI